MLALVSVSAQEPPTTNDPPEVVGGLAFIDEVELTVVNIDVFVTEKGGQAVTDLDVDDFVVRPGRPETAAQPLCALHRGSDLEDRPGTRRTHRSPRRSQPPKLLSPNRSRP